MQVIILVLAPKSLKRPLLPKAKGDAVGSGGAMGASACVSALFGALGWAD